jgi:hypothetical protein
MRKKAPATAATPGGDNHRDPSRLRGVPLVLGILLLAANLRPALTGVAPLIGQIRTDTDVSDGVAGLLTTLPLLAFGALSPVAPRLARQFGMERTVLVSLLALAVGIVVRSMGAVWALFLGTAVVGAGIVVGNVLLPGLVKREFSRTCRPHDKYLHHRVGHQCRTRGRRERPDNGPDRHRLARIFGLVGPPRPPRRRRVASSAPP